MTGDRRLHALAFAALAVFASLHWAAMVSPDAGGALLLAVALTVAAGLADPAWWPRSGLARGAAAAAAWVGGLAVALLLAGVPPGTLLPGGWDELGAGLASGLEALPGLRVPYDGPEEWARRAIVGGGILLVVAGGVLALRARRPIAAAAALGVLYAVPVVERDPGSPYVSGAVFAVLTAALVWGHRIRRQDLPAGASLVAAATAAGLLVAPRVDASAPWLDYEQLARDLDAQRTSSFVWEHRYGALEWPREGREVLRVRSPEPAYWKAVALERFDGVRWRQALRVDPGQQDTEVLRDSWRRNLRFQVGALRTRQIIGAGTTIRVRGARTGALEITPGSFEVVRAPLRRGDQYVARTYVARPTAQRMREAGTDYPAFVGRQLAVDLPGIDDPTVLVPAWGSDEPAYVLRRSGLPSTDGVQRIRSSPYRRMYELARRQRAASASPYDFARRVSAFLQRDATYTETPPRAALPLDAFVFERREGYCQQFSGAMALLLRLGGVPARVASGFSPGTQDEDGGSWVVRDFDAHSWVEVYFPRIGWVAFDPTPAAAPALGRAPDSDAAGASPADAAADEDRRREQAPDAAAGAGAGGSEAGPRWPVLAGGGLALVALAGGLVTWRRRTLLREDGVPVELAEVLRALQATGRRSTMATTLHQLEWRLGPGPAADYLRSLRERRYGPVPGDPSPLGRAALRRELTAGVDLRARVRAWAALPPGRRELRARLRRGR